MRSVEKKLREKQPQWGAALAGMLVSLFLCVTAIGSAPAGGSAAYALGTALIPAIVMWFVLRGSPVLFRLGWIGLLVAIVFGVASARQDSTKKMDALMSDTSAAADQIGEIMKAGHEGAAIKVPDGLQAPTSDDPYAMAGYYVKRVVVLRAQSHNRYLGELDAAGWERVLEPDELRKPDARAVLAERVKKAHVSINAWIGRERATTRDFIRDMRALKLPAGFASGIEKGASSSDFERQFEEVADSERSIVDAIQRVAEVFLAHRWQMQGEELLFETEAGLSAYRSANAALEQRMADQERLNAQQKAKFETLRKRLDEMAP